MKLKKKLVVIFITIMLLPIVLSVVVYWAMGLGLLYNVRKVSLGEDAKFTFSDPSSAYNKAIDEYYDLLERLVKEKPESLENAEYLAETDENLQEVSAYLVVKKADKIFYVSPKMESEEIISHLPVGAGRNGAGYDFYFNEYERLVKEIDFTFADGTPGSVFVITRINMMISDTLITTMFIVVVIVLFITIMIMSQWLKRSIFKPLNEMKETIEKIEEERKETESTNRELISNITHDLKTPITSIKGYVEGIMDGVADSPEKMEKYVRTIYTKANDMDRMINELTMYSRIETNSIPYEFHDISVKDYFDDCADEVGFDVESRGIHFFYECQMERNRMILADAEQLKRVIDNVISNSIKYAKETGARIMLRVLEEETKIHIEIEDNGKGIPASELDKVFERFYRTDASRNSSQGGSGIGLSIAKRIVEEHDGRIYATGDVGKGVCVHIELKKYIRKDGEEIAEDNKGFHKIEKMIKSTAKGIRSEAETRIQGLNKIVSEKKTDNGEKGVEEKSDAPKEGLFKWLNKDRGGKADE